MLGGHIEQKQTARQEYPMCTEYQPEEHVLQLDVSILKKVAPGLKEIDDEEIDDEEERVQHMFDEFSRWLLSRPRTKGQVSWLVEDRIRYR